MDIITTHTTELTTVESDPYQAALATWLQGKPDSTRTSYTSALRDFLAFTVKNSPDGRPKHPRDVVPLDVAQWKVAMKGRGLSDSTIAQRLSALSSYYSYLQKPQADGQPIQEYNPVNGVGRDDLEVNPYARARKLSLTDFQRILAVIPTETAQGARDRALLLFYVICGRRRAEVVNLRGRDLRLDGQRVVYRVRLKRGQVKWKELPPPVWDAIRHYLDLAERTLADNDPVFLPTVDNGEYLRQYHGMSDPEELQPITGEGVAQALKRYARRAGLDPDKICLHSLRHLGAELYHQASGDVRQTQLFLDHSLLSTTQIYLEQLAGEEHKHWQAMANKLGV